MRRPHPRTAAFGTWFSLAGALWLSGCLFGGEEDAPVNQGVQPGLYRLDYGPLFTSWGWEHDSGITSELYLDPGGRFRFFFSDTLYGRNVPLIVLGGDWASNGTSLIQSPRTYAEGSTPGIFERVDMPPDSAPARGITASVFQRYEQNILMQGNWWVTYRRIEPPPPLSGRYVHRDTFLTEDSLPVAWMEEWRLNPGGSFSLRYSENGALLAELASAAWMQAGHHVVLIAPRLRFYDTLGVSSPWETLPVEWVFSLRNTEGNKFESWMADDWFTGTWATFRAEAALAKAAPLPDPGVDPAYTAPRPASFGGANPRWRRETFPSRGLSGPAGARIGDSGLSPASTHGLWRKDVIPRR